MPTRFTSEACSRRICRRSSRCAGRSARAAFPARRPTPSRRTSGRRCSTTAPSNPARGDSGRVVRRPGRRALDADADEPDRRGGLRGHVGGRLSDALEAGRRSSSTCSMASSCPIRPGTGPPCSRTSPPANEPRSRPSTGRSSGWPQQHGIDVPYNQAVYNLIKFIEKARQWPARE